MIRHFLKDEYGSVTIEFTTIFVPVILFVVMISEIAIAFHITSSAQKAAQHAARVLATRDPVNSLVWETNLLNPTNGSAGDACFQEAGDACVDPGTIWVCDGASLDVACVDSDFDAFIAEVRRLYPSVNAEDVSVRYIYRRLGVAQGPFVPEVQVTIAERPMPINLLSWVGLLQLRATSASTIGEDMNT